MKKTALLCFTTLLTACQSNQITEKDFSNTTYTSQFVVDSTLTKGDNMAAGMALAFMANAKTEYAFKDAPAGTYRAEMGAIVGERPFTWSVKGDSLTISIKGGENTAFKATRADNAVKLVSGSTTLLLTPKTAK